jgi:hypothetical protein
MGDARTAATGLVEVIWWSSMRDLGRPERALPVGGDPIALFAGELREMRKRARNLGYREMSRRANFSASVLSTAAAGRVLPTLPVMRAYATACGENPDVWEARWYEVCGQLGRLRAVVPGSSEPERGPAGLPHDGLLESQVPAQLPPDIADFTGRAPELDYLRGKLSSRETSSADRAPGRSVIVLAGSAGVGKTTLGIRAGLEARALYPDGQLFVNLHGHGEQRVSVTEALGRVLRALGVSADRVPTEMEERAALYRTVLANRRVLVLADDVADEASARPLLPPAPGCACVLTSRSALLGLEGVDRLEVREFCEPTATQFLTRLIGKDRVAREPAAGAQIVQLCCGLPLALRIAGARLSARPHWPLATYARHLDSENTRLSELTAGDLAVRSSLSLSYNKLGERGRLMYRRLGLMPGPEFGAAAVAAVIDDSIDAVKRDLEALTDASLLASPAPGRYRFQHLGQLFARECLVRHEAATEVSQADERLCAWYDQSARGAAAVLAVSESGYRASTARSLLPSYDAALEWLEQELPSVLEVIGRLAAGAGPDRAIRLVESVADFLHGGQHWRAYRLACEHALFAARSAGDAASEAAMLRRLSIVDRHSRSG